jgi:hypothetical protein
MIRFTTLSAAFAAAAFSVLLSGPAYAGDSRQQIATAAAHAGMAAESADMKMVKAHLQHVINCLVGPAGAGYDSTQANPCKEQGFGAIPDASFEKMASLEAALKMAKDGKAEADIAKAREKAAATQAALGKLSK